ncbi:MAG: LLM class flavin-dependent oxidoreductase [Actinobacteria bacterium]|nr:LLM class flavin-dependent oxidoreductase [Actinomycetota bacterium]
MKFGIFYEHQLPRPWADDSEQQLINDALEQVELADKLGFDVVWEVEHHFLEEYSHSSAPEVFLAACSQRAPNIRLGHGIVQTPPPFNHPARVAERIAMLDLVSNGRVEFGTGESSSEAELGGFNIDPVFKREMWQEGLEVAVRCMTETPFAGVDGKFVQMPPRNVVPKPVQKPHPPLWVACSRRDTIHLAAQKGIGALTFAFIDPEEAEHWLGDYYATLENECVPIGQAVNPNVACVTTFMCAPTEDEAIARGIEGANFFGYSLAHFYVFGQHRPGVTDVWAEYLQKRDEVGYSAEVAAAAEQDRLGAKIAQDGITGLRGAIGTPDQIRDYLRRYEECGVDQIIFVSQAGKNKHEHIMESLELFGREVMPEFMDRDEQHVKNKAVRVEPIVEKAMARKLDDAPTMPEDYVMPAMPRAWADRTGDETIKAMLEKIQEDRAAGRTDPAAGIIGDN